VDKTQVKNDSDAGAVGGGEGGSKTKSWKRSYGRKNMNQKNHCWRWLDLPRRTKIKEGVQAKNRVEQNEIRAKIHYGSRKQKWILSKKMNDTKQDTKNRFFPLKTKHDYNSER
jgi:hypothetical protein